MANRTPFGVGDDALNLAVLQMLWQSLQNPGSGLRSLRSFETYVDSLLQDRSEADTFFNTAREFAKTLRAAHEPGHQSNHPLSPTLSLAPGISKQKGWVPFAAGMMDGVWGLGAATALSALGLAANPIQGLRDLKNTLDQGATALKFLFSNLPQATQIGAQAVVKAIQNIPGLSDYDKGKLLVQAVLVVITTVGAVKAATQLTALAKKIKSGEIRHLNQVKTWLNTPGKKPNPTQDTPGKLVHVDTVPPVNRKKETRLLGQVPKTEVERVQVVERFLNYPFDHDFNKVAEGALGARKQIIKRIGDAEYTRQGWKRLTDSELVAIDEYTDTGALAGNAARRQKFNLENFPGGREDPSDGQIIRLSLQLSEIVSGALKKLPTFKGIVYRGLNLNPQDLAKHQPGKIVVYPAFSSTSVDENLAFNGNVLLKIQSHTGTDLRALNPREKEVLFDHDSKFFVKSRRNLENYVEIELEQIP